MKSYIKIMMLLLISNVIIGQGILEVSLSNPVVLSSTQIKWDIYVRNASAGGQVLTIATANLPQRRVSGTVTGAVSNPLTLELEPEFSTLAFTPMVQVVGGVTVFRLNGGAVPSPQPIVTQSEQKLGTVTFTSAAAMTFPFSIGSTTGTPNVVISGTVNGTPTTFQLTNGNLLLLNAWNVNPIQMEQTAPVELGDFTAEKLGERSAKLDWTTVTETNSSHFGIERSENGSKWENIGRVQAAGFSRQERVYGFVDNKLPRITAAGKVIYYRLKMADKDGRYQYSDMRTVIFEGKEEGRIVLYPNPATNLVNLDLSGVGHNGGQLELSVMDVDGKLVMQRTIEGVDSYELDVAELSANVYQIRISQGDRVYQTRLVKVD